MLKDKVLLILVFLIFMVSLLLSLNVLTDVDFKEEDKMQLISYVSHDKSIINDPDYLGIISIPKIKLNQGFYDTSSPLNNVNKNIKLIKDDFPHILVLASHRGNSRVSYFNNINKLNKGDEVIINYRHREYKYYYNYKYLDDKDGKVNIKYNHDKNTLILITCDKKDKDSHLVLVLYQK